MADLSEFDPLASPKDNNLKPTQSAEIDPLSTSNDVAPLEEVPPQLGESAESPEQGQTLDPEELANKMSTPNARRTSIGDGAAKPVSEEDKPFDFQEFLNQMRTRSADPVARYVKSFLTEFSKKNWTAKEQIKIIKDFRSFIKGKMGQIAPFADMDDIGWNNAQEGMEKLVMNRLYGRTFSPKMVKRLRRDDHEEDLLRDKVLTEKLRIWSWIEGRHLDINDEYIENGESFVHLASTELSKINHYRAPRDKMICIMNCSKVIWALIRQAKLEQNADSFLPLLIFVVLRAQPSYLISNINYINRFRSTANKQGEAGYYLSMAASAVAFVEGLERSSLSITDEEFKTKIESAVQAEKERSQQGLGAHDDVPDEDVVAASEPLMASSVLSTSAGILVEQLRSYATKIFEPEDVSTPSRPGSPQAGSELLESPEEAAARQASAEMYRAEQLQQKEFASIANALQEMFPMLDRDVLEDVLRQKGTRIGAAIDVCAALVGEN